MLFGFLFVWCFLGDTYACGGVVSMLESWFWVLFGCGYLVGNSTLSYVEHLERAEPVYL